MIDIVQNTSGSRKQIQQIGTPGQEERLYVCRMAKALGQKDSIVCSAFTFMVSYNCNFKCPYCFEQKGTANEPLMATMSKQCVDACFEAMEELQQNKLKRSTKIALFGGLFSVF